MMLQSLSSSDKLQVAWIKRASKTNLISSGLVRVWYKTDLLSELLLEQACVKTDTFVYGWFIYLFNFFSILENNS